MLTRRFFGILAALTIFAGILTFSAKPALHGRSAAVAHASAARRSGNLLGNLPLSFEQNAGQTDARIKFLARGAGYTLFLSPQETVLSLQSPSSHAPRKTTLALQNPAKLGPHTAAVLRMELAGANSQASLAGAQPLPGKVNYFIGNNPSAWRTGVPTFGAVRYSAVYPGVDMIFHGNARTLEYDFTVAPGADPARIALRMEGASSLRVDASGDAVLDTAAGPVRLHKPVLYQTIAANIRPVDGSYDLRPDGTLGFRVGSYDARQPLVIDPIISYSTYYGGTMNDTANGMALDSSGNIYFAGTTSSIDFPVFNAFDPTNPNGGIGPAAFVTKLDPTGTTQIFSTYFGGTSFEIGNAMAVDAGGNVYIGGITGSTDLPLTGNAFQNVLPGNTAGFITKFDPTGQSLLFSSYLGGNFSSSVNAIAVNSSADAFLVGQTTSNTFPVSPNGFQKQPKSPTADAFVTELNTNGPGGPADLIYSSYLGGSASGGINGNPGMCDTATGVAIDSARNFYVTGTAFSTDYPTNGTLAPFQASLSGPNDAFLTVLSSTIGGQAGLLYSTYLGGTGNEQGAGIALDSTNNAYITGFTSSTDYPVTSGVFQSVLGGGSGSDGFVAKFNPAASGSASLIYSTYLGGSNGDFPAAIVLDSIGDVYVAGQTFSQDYPTSNAVQDSNNALNGSGNAFASELDPNGANLIFSTFLGGSGTTVGGDGANGIAIDSLGNIYLTGFANSTNFPVTNNAFQPSNADSTGMTADAFLSIIAFEITASPSALTFTVSDIGITSPPQIVTITNTSGAAFTATASITGLNVSNFFQTNNCNVSVPPLGTCTVNVTFTSSSATTAFAFLNVVTNSGVSASPVSLTGITTLPAVQLLPTSLDFGPEVVGTSSAPQTVTLRNSGGADLTLTSVAITGTNTADFILGANTCTGTIAPGATCTSMVTFTPTATGARSANLTFTDNALDSPENVPLTGTGSSAAAVTLSPTSLTFAPQTVGTTSAALPVTLTNSGSATLNITSIAVTGANLTDFAQTNTCGTSVAAGASCTISVTFTPTATGTRSASVTITDDAPDSPQNVPLSGTGTAGAAVTLSPTSLNFPSQTINSTSAALPVTLTNSGSATLTITSIAVTGTNSTEFAQTNTCGTSVAAGANCTISVTFAPTSASVRSASVTITDNAADSPQNVPLTGTGMDFSAPSNSPGSITLPAGQSGSFAATIMPIPAGTTFGAVSFTCTGAPAASTCVPGASVTNADGSVTSNVAITTTVRSAVPFLRFTAPPAAPVRPLLLFSLGLALALGTFLLAGRMHPVWLDGRHLATAALVLVMLSLGLLVACGGGSGGGGGGGGGGGTPAGTYMLTVTATSNGLAHASTFTLTVQ